MVKPGEVRTVFERAGDEAVEAASALAARHPQIIDRAQADMLIGAERTFAVLARERARAENRDNDDRSLAPGLRATLTGDGYDMARDVAQETGFQLEEAVLANGGLAVVTLSQGAFEINSNNASYFFAHATLGGEGQVEHAREASFYVTNPGVVMIEGLAAQERWLNPAFNPDGSPR